MGLDRYPDLDPDDGQVVDAEVAVTDDVLVKAFALGPGAELSPHEHADATNVFHVLEGAVTVIQGDDEEAVEAPGVVLHERGDGSRRAQRDRRASGADREPLSASVLSSGRSRNLWLSPLGVVGLAVSGLTSGRPHGASGRGSSRLRT